MANSKIMEDYRRAEIRQYPRINENRSFIFYNLQKRNTQKTKESIINNISINGLCFDTPEEIKPRVNLECEIYQPIDNQKHIVVSISVLAKLIWIRKIDNSNDSGSNKYRLGLKFIRISPMDKEKITKYINERMGKRK